MRLTDKILRLLTLLEHGPKYGRQFALIAPELFAADNVIATGKKKPDTLAVQNIYVLLRRVKSGGLIEELTDFEPADDDESGVSRRKYYGITREGRKVLDSARKSLSRP